MDRKTHTHILNIWGAYGGSSRTCMKLGTLFLDSEIGTALWANYTV